MELRLKELNRRFDNTPSHQQSAIQSELINQYAAIGQRDRLLQLLRISCKIDAPKRQF